MTIELFNPTDIPFGELSNNATYVMNIDKEIWTSVTKFIYSNMINNFVYRGLLKKSELKNIYEEYLKYLKKNSEDIITKSLDEALRVKFENPQVLEILLRTDDADILYISNNELLGVGSNNTGSNILGKYLMQIRDQIKNTKIRDQKIVEEQTQLYKAFIIYKLLLKDMMNDGDDLSEYLYAQDPAKIFQYYIIRNLDDIINIYLKKHPSVNRESIYNTIENDKYGKNFFLETYADDPELMPILKISILNPVVIIFYLRKMNLKTVRSKSEYILLNKVFNLYVRYILENNYTNLPTSKYEDAIEQQLGTITGYEFDQLKKRLYLVKEQLPAPLYEEINNFIKTLKIPSEEQVKFAETFDINMFITNDINNMENPFFQGEAPKRKKIIKIYQGNPSPNFIDDLQLLKSYSFQLLSPIYYTGLLKIKEEVYPTVTHYIVANLYASIPSIGSLKEAHNYIKGPDGWLNYKFLYDRYLQMSEEYDNAKMKKLAEIGLNKKFENRRLQNLLLKTENNEIIWKDYKNNILGIGKNNKGENFVGKYLMKLRDDILKKQGEENLSLVSEENISDLVQNDIFIQNWLRMRIEDMVNIAKKMRTYLDVKYSVNVETDSLLFNIALDNIYQPCSELFEISKDINIQQVPIFFVSLVKEYVKSRQLSSIIETLWRRVVVMLYFVIKNLPNPTLYNIKNVLIKIEKIVSTQTNETPILENTDDNCIISAIINILIGINNFNKQTYRFTKNREIVIANKQKYDVGQIYVDPSVQKYDVELAASIILNTNVKNININIENKKNVPIIAFPVEAVEKEEVKEPEAVLVEEEVMEEMEEEQFAEEDEEDQENFDYPDESEPEGEDAGDCDGAGCDGGDFYDGADYDNTDYDGIGYDSGFYDGADEDDEGRNKEDINKLVNYLKNYPTDVLKIPNYDLTAKYIISATKIIKEYKMNKNVKNNRINFFSNIC